MKGLEALITAKLFAGVEIVSTISHQPDGLGENIKLLAEEVRELAIGFHLYSKEFKPVANGQPDLYQHPTLRKVLTIDDIFDAFLKEKYKA